MELNDYLNPSSLRALCKTIAMPDEVTDCAARIASDRKALCAAPYFEALLLPASAAEAQAKITEAVRQRFTEPEAGFVELTVSLAGALRVKEDYERDGIPEEIFIDTMKCFSRFVGEVKLRTGAYGFDRFVWTWRQLTRQIYRLGTLEIDLRDRASGSICIHIPSDAALNVLNCRASYRRALDFLARFYPDVPVHEFACRTWLLSPIIADVLRDDSRIRQFQLDYTLCESDPDSDAGFRWLFGKPAGFPLEDLPEDTSLRRAMKARMLAGGHIGVGGGVIPAERVREWNADGTWATGRRDTDL